MFFMDYKIMMDTAQVWKIVFLYIPIMRLVNRWRSSNVKIIFLAKKTLVIFGQLLHPFQLFFLARIIVAHFAFNKYHFLIYKILPVSE